MKKLTDKDFSFICPMVWDEMPESANGRFCAGCRKEVFDLSNCSIGEVRELQRKHGPICGSIKVVRAAAVVASLTAAACQDNSHSRTTGAPFPEKPGQENVQVKVITPHQGKPVPQPMVLGEICLPKELEKKTGE